ncbi:MAG: protein phosphatase 2C domain-containing protein [Anaerolineales bacterium]|nr:protein phosphatase 2C domain-containing protein [Anaerolineales bacterium]
MQRCPNCSEENRTGARFCRVCGQSLAPDAASEPAVIQLDEEPGQAGVAEPVDQPEELEIGQVLLQRYWLVRRLESEGAIQVFEAEDLLLCRSCQAVQSEAGLRFCEACGAELAEKPKVILKAYLEAAEFEPLEAVESFSEAGIAFVIERLVSSVEPQAQSVFPDLRLFCGFQSHPGKIRENNEDSLVALQLAGICEMQCSPPMGFFAVADGVGGASSGEIASRTAVGCLVEGVMQKVMIPEISGRPLPGDQFTQIARQLVLAANQAIIELRKQVAEDDMGCTLTAILVRGLQAVVVNVGDSRTYRLRQGRLAAVTQDHSIVARLLEQGLIQQEEVYTHHQRSVIYRSLGGRADIEVDIFPLELEPGERLLLCSDGLWEMVRDQMIEEVLLERSDPQQVCNRLVELANLAGGEDNISVIVLDVHE